MEQTKELAGCDAQREAADVFFCRESLIDRNFSLSFSFLDGEFVRAGYVLADSPTNAAIYFDVYEQLKSLLIEKYGNPSTESEKVITDPMSLYRDREYALVMGELKWSVTWERAQTNIGLVIYGDNGKADLVLVYESVAHLEAVAEAKRKENLKKM